MGGDAGGARLVSVNVGMPRDIPWRGKVVHTGIWKDAVAGRRRVARLNVEGDGQGDLAGHGGEHRAVFVYQTGSYSHWAEALGRDDLVPGQFGENFTVDGLADDQVCIGDRYRIGSALFEVTQPRVTCYRVGIRMDHPQMAALLTSSGRPGFYFRVIEEGDVGAGDAIELVARPPESMTVTEINALLYAPPHPKAALAKALRISALSDGWRRSFEALAQAPEGASGVTGNAGLAPATARAAPGFRPLCVAQIDHQAGIATLDLRPADGGSLTEPLPGQYVVLRLKPHADGPPLFRSYSLSGPPSSERYRISVKIEPDGAAGAFLSTHVRQGDAIDVSAPRGAFTLRPGSGAVALLSAGIGLTPVLAMLHALAARGSPRPVWWLHAARNGASYVFEPEVRRLLAALGQGQSCVWFTRPAADEREGRAFDIRGRPTVDALRDRGVPRNADFYLCGPAGFIDGLTAGLAQWGVPKERLHSELFAGGPAFTPGIVGASTRAPHPPEPIGSGPLVSFARSGIATRWRAQDQSLLELAEACDIPVRWSCRAGVCHTCESGLLSGAVDNQPEPLDPPADGNLLLCCARPRGDLVIDL